MTREEQKEVRGGIVIDTERCKGCALCEHACKKGVIEMTRTSVNQHGYCYAMSAHPEACVGCAACGIVCPDGCITVFRLPDTPKA